MEFVVARGATAGDYRTRASAGCGSRRGRSRRPGCDFGSGAARGRGGSGRVRRAIVHEKRVVDAPDHDDHENAERPEFVFVFGANFHWTPPSADTGICAGPEGAPVSPPAASLIKVSILTVTFNV